MSQQIGMNPNSNIVQIPGYIKSEKNNIYFLVCRSGKKYEIHFEEPLLVMLKKYAGNHVFLGGMISDDKESVNLSYLKQDDRFRNQISNNFTPVSARDDSPDDEFDPIDDELPKKSKVKSAS